MKITDHVFWVGVLNPNMRIFDVVMRTEYGTSYNSYVVKGEKTALIDVCHERFFDEYLLHINEVVSLKQIDYLIVNHCEPDHTGALKKLINLVPNLKILTTPAGSINLKLITNNDKLNITVVKDGETLDLGSGLVLKFFFAPFLHWPDTMFTYLAKEQMVFTCDFLGSHYCEPSMHDSRVQYPDAYIKAVQEYYDAIFGPFPKYVNDGLKILKQLDLQYICTSHGPVLTKTGKYQLIYQMYQKSSQPHTAKYSIPIFYASAYGFTKKAALAIQQGIKATDASIECNIYDVNEHAIDKLMGILNEANAFCLGSPTLNKNAVPPILNLLSCIDAINCQAKPVLIFGSYGWSGEASGVLTSYANSLKLKVYDQVAKFRFSPDEKTLKQVQDTAKAFVQFAKTI